METLANILSFIFLLSFIALVLAFVKPSLFKTSRKKAAIIAGSLLILSFIGVGITAPTQTTDSTKQQPTSQSTPQTQDSETVEPEEEKAKFADDNEKVESKPVDKEGSPKPKTESPKASATKPQTAPVMTVPDAPEPTAYYKNCTAVKNAGAAPIFKGQPGYGYHLDRDKDGIGCEK